MSNIGFENINISSAIHSREETLKKQNNGKYGNSNLDFRLKKKKSIMTMKLACTRRGECYMISSKTINSTT